MNNSRYFSSTPPVVLNLIIINALMLLATELLPVGNRIVGALALFNVESPLFHSYQLVTYMFLHGGFSHLFFNMFALWMFGRTLEYELGSKRFLTYYMVCGVGAGVLQLLVGWLEYRYGNGESMFELAQRIYNLLDELKEQQDKTYILVAHNGIARVVQSYFKDMTNEEYAAFGVQNCSVTEFSFEEKKGTCK